MSSKIDMIALAKTPRIVSPIAGTVKYAYI